MSVRITGRIGVGYVNSRDGELEFGQHWDEANCEAMAEALECLATQLRKRASKAEENASMADGHSQRLPSTMVVPIKAVG